MYFKLILLLVGVTTVLSFPKSAITKEAESCDVEACQLPDCRCLSTDVPNSLEPSEIPQLVLLTFDDAVTVTNFDFYKTFFDRVNPDGCPISTTYFISHEYTDYSKVHELHARGHEIALHSISHESQTSYWDDLTLEEYLVEFDGQIELTSHFANIPSEDIKGMRVPFLQLGGDTSFEAIKELGLTYDSSWPTQNYVDPPLWPYTLDYASTQDCPIGACPTSSIPGVWVQPMVNWIDDAGQECSMVDACINIPDDVDGIVEYMKRNFNRHYESNRAPFGFFVHSAWFIANPVHYDAYLVFLDYLQSLDDVYIVNVNKALEWVRNPTPTNDLKSLWPECQATYEPNCTPITCELRKGEEYRYMTNCATSCPAVYPWLGNPLGI